MPAVQGKNFQFRNENFAFSANLGRVHVLKCCWCKTSSETGRDFKKFDKNQKIIP